MVKFIVASHWSLVLYDVIFLCHFPYDLVTTWRSGSSFTGGLLDEFPGTFYSYEPLLYNELSKDKDM